MRMECLSTKSESRFRHREVLPDFHLLAEMKACPEGIPVRLAGMGAASLLLSALIVYTVFWMPDVPMLFSRRLTPFLNMTAAASKDELQTILESASMENKTLIISVLNKAYVQENGMLDLFLQSLKQGENTEFLIKHLLLVAMDQIAFDRCKLLNLNCYLLETKDVDFSKEQLYMSDGFIKMMWQRTHFLGDVLKRGYNFIFTDMDVMWLRNPFTKLSHQGEDMQISCDEFYGNPFSNSNLINTGFYFVTSNNKTTSLFDAWYEARNNSGGMKEQDVLARMKTEGTFTQLSLKVRYLDTLYFSGFCQVSKDIRQVTTVHANCCRSVNAKLTDLSKMLEAWRSSNGTTTIQWSHRACSESWKKKIIV